MSRVGPGGMSRGGLGGLGGLRTKACDYFYFLLFPAYVSSHNSMSPSARRAKAQKAL